MAKIMIFAGTTEGRLLTEAAAGQLDKGLQVWVSVATEYGRDILTGVVTKKEGLNLISGRLDEVDMAELFAREQFDYVIDTTHPYAQVVTGNIARQCEAAGIPRIRVLRAESMGETAAECFAGNAAEAQGEETRGNMSETTGEQSGGKIVYVENSQAAAEYLNQTEGRVFLTTGSKELEAFTAVAGYEERLVARVLPMPGVVEHCLGLGFGGRQLICMQGPFSYEMNVALFRQTKASHMVTKDSGDTGGFQEKLRAARELGMTTVVIGRNRKDQGLALEAAVELLNEKLKLNLELPKSAGAGLQLGIHTSAGGEPQEKATLEHTPDSGVSKESGQCKDVVKHEENDTAEGDWFPLFINIKGKKVVVAGGGKIAKRRIRNLMQFSADVTVIAEEPAEQVRAFAEQGRLALVQRQWRMADMDGADCVIAATNDRTVNHAIYEECKKRGILVNVADRKEECDFYFPGVVRRGDLTIGITAEGKNHSLAKLARQAVDEAVKKL